MSQIITNITAGLFHPYNFETLTIDNTAGGIGFTQSIINASTANPLYQCQHVVITAETAQMRYNYDGSVPTTASGHILNPNDVLSLLGWQAINSFRAIRVGGTSGTLMVTYER